MITAENVKKLIMPDEFDDFSMFEVINQLKNIDPTMKYGHGSSRFAIITKNEVIKIPFYFSNGDKFYNYERYCEAEVHTYNAAAGIGLKSFFSSVKYGGEILYNHTPFYVYERIETFYKKLYKTPSKKSLEKANKSFVDIDTDWLAYCYDFYKDDDFIQEFLYFLDEREINDLHSENVGFRKDGTPCLCDYAGYS